MVALATPDWRLRRRRIFIKREVYRLSRNGVSFLISGMIVFAFLYKLPSGQSVLSWKEIESVLILSGIWMGIGLLQIVGYCFCIYAMETEGEEKNV